MNTSAFKLNSLLICSKTRVNTGINFVNNNNAFKTQILWEYKLRDK